MSTLEYLCNLTSMLRNLGKVYVLIHTMFYFRGSCVHFSEDIEPQIVTYLELPYCLLSSPSTESLPEFLC